MATRTVKTSQGTIRSIVSPHARATYVTPPVTGSGRNVMGGGRSATYGAANVKTVINPLARQTHVV